MNKDFEKLRIATKKHYTKCVFDFDYIRKKIFDRSLLRKWMRKNNFSEKKIFDIGCGGGSVGSFIVKLFPECKLFSADLSSDAVRITKNRNLNVFVGDNLNLPIKNNASDLTISEGVIHHTPNPYRAFKELIRITNVGGKISLYVYNKGNYYYYIYKLGFLVRFFYKKKITKKIVEGLIFNLFHIFYVQLGNFFYFKSPKVVSRKISWNIFSDQILTPVAHFYLKEDIMEWASQNNLEVLDYQKSLNGQGLQFILLKM
jgi:SAM-dependent methyltransferase